MRISDWSSDVCSSDLTAAHRHAGRFKPLPIMASWHHQRRPFERWPGRSNFSRAFHDSPALPMGCPIQRGEDPVDHAGAARRLGKLAAREVRSEEHTSELPSLMRISYAVFCLKKNTPNLHNNTTRPQ